MIQSIEHQITFSLIWSRAKRLRSPLCDMNQGKEDQITCSLIWSWVKEIRSPLPRSWSSQRRSKSHDLKLFSEIYAGAREIWGVSFAVAAKWCARFLLRPTKLSARANGWPNTDPHPKRLKQKYSNDSAYVSWWSKAPSATGGKLLKFVMVMIEKWFNHHSHYFFQVYALTHKKSALTLAVDQSTWRHFLEIF